MSAWHISQRQSGCCCFTESQFSRHALWTSATLPAHAHGDTLSASCAGSLQYLQVIGGRFLSFFAFFWSFSLPYQW
jgi:hypothetical protein